MKSLKKTFTKKISKVLLSLLTLSLVIPNGITPSAATVDQATVNFTVTGELKAGNIVDVAVNVNNATDLYGASLDFTYDKTLLEVQSVTPGTVFPADVNVPVKKIGTVPGSVETAMTLTGSQKAEATTGTVATMKVKLLKDGKVTLKASNSDAALSPNGINVRVKLAASDASSIAYKATDKEIVIGNTSGPQTSKLTSFTANKPNVLVGENITFTATATPSADTLYEFYIYENGSWVRKQPFSTNNVLSYKTDKPGSYQARVFVKHVKSSAKNDDSLTLKFNVTTSTATVSKPGTLTPNLKVGKVGTPTIFTATATPASDTLYEFYVYQNNVWQRTQAFSSKNSFTFTPDQKGAIKVRAFVKHVNSKNKSDGYVDITYTIVGSDANDISTVSDLNISNSAPTVNSNITFTAIATPSSDTLYEFYIYENSTWVRKQLFSTNNSFAYKPTKAGSYQARVFVKHKNSKEKYDDQFTLKFDVK